MFISKKYGQSFQVCIIFKSENDIEKAVEQKVSCEDAERVGVYTRLGNKVRIYWMMRGC